MKDLIIANINDIPGVTTSRGENNNFTVHAVIAPHEANKISASFVTVPPKNFAFGYHYHDQVEEIFYVVKGEGSLRTYQGEKPVRAGDMLCFPTGEKGAHVLSNTSETEELVFLDFGTKVAAEIVVLPDINKMMIMGDHFPFTLMDMPATE